MYKLINVNLIAINKALLAYINTKLGAGLVSIVIIGTIELRFRCHQS